MASHAFDRVGQTKDDAYFLWQDRSESLSPRPKQHTCGKTECVKKTEDAAGRTVHQISVEDDDDHTAALGASEWGFDRLPDNTSVPHGLQRSLLSSMSAFGLPLVREPLMILGIKPTVDFAFKKIFGSPQNAAALIGLLNAILNLRRAIVSVEILNPFSYQEFTESKLIVLDVRCRDSSGRFLNVEMQVSVYGGLIERLVYYACSMYVDHLSKGGNYATASPSISICMLNHVLFPDTSQSHHRFEMRDRESDRKLENAI
jgi:hypothetical protein